MDDSRKIKGFSQARQTFTGGHTWHLVWPKHSTIQFKTIEALQFTNHRYERAWSFYAIMKRHLCWSVFKCKWLNHRKHKQHGNLIWFFYSENHSNMTLNLIVAWNNGFVKKKSKKTWSLAICLLALGWRPESLLSLPTTLISILTKK